MSLSAWTEMRLAVGGALRIAVGDRRALGCFDASIDGFWRSFRAAAVCYPLYLAATRLVSAQQGTSGTVTAVVVDTIGYAIAWVAFPLLILPIARWFGREERFLVFMVVYNWSQIPQWALFAAIGVDAATGLLAFSAVQLAELAATLATLVYEWYVARVTLRVAAAPAMLIVILDLLLGAVLGRIDDALH